MRSGLLLAQVVRSAPLASASVAIFAEGLTGSVLAYNVSGEPRESVSPAFGQWSKLQVRLLSYVAMVNVNRRGQDLTDFGTGATDV